jgi:hypothetical protein
LSAFFMNSVQMRAGNEPPVSDVIPPIPLRDWVALSRKKATEAAICGVYALNQADAFDCDVQVFPATGRPNASAAAPVPPVIVPFNA